MGHGHEGVLLCTQSREGDDLYGHFFSMWATKMPGTLPTVPCKVTDDSQVASLVFSLIVCLSTLLTRMIG